MKLSLGENIRRLRRDRDMTQEQLADALAVSFQAVSRWENGSTYPDLELIPAIAEFFSVSTDELLGVPEAEKNRQAEVLVMRYADIINNEYPAADAQKKVELRARLAEIVKSLRRDFRAPKQRQHFLHRLARLRCRSRSCRNTGFWRRRS